MDAGGQQLVVDGALVVRLDLQLPFSVAYATDRVLLHEAEHRRHAKP